MDRAQARAPAGEPRVENAERLLRERGFASAIVRVVGHEGEIAAVAVARRDWERLLEEGSEIATELRRLGFRYVALDLEPRAS